MKEDDPERIKLVRQVIGQEVQFPVQYPATWHSPRRDHHASDAKVPYYLRLDKPSHPKSFKEFLGGLFGQLKRRVLGLMGINRC